MRFQKAIKRMIALGIGAVMLSSMASAAVDLANYPAPFIKDGKFQGVLVVGDKAAAEDVIGISDIIASLQFAATKKVEAAAAGTVSVEGDAWQVATSNHLELSEDGNTADTVETLRNITTYVDKNNLKALASGSIDTGKATSPYNQYLYLLGPGAGTTLDTGYVIYTENDADKTADFLYFKSGREIGRYLIEFTTALESDVDDSAGSASTTGLFLTDYQDRDITMFGKKYTIVTAKRTTTAGSSVVLTLMGGAGKDSLLEKTTKTYTIGGKNYEVTLNFVDSDEAQFVINGQITRKMKDGDTDKLADGTSVGVTDVLYQDYAGGIHSSTFFIGANKLELKDTDVTDVVSSNSLKVDDNTIDDATVIIEGSDTNSTFKITRIHVNMTADDNFFVAAGKKLSDAIKEEGGSAAEPQVLFTENWDIEYKGLKKVKTEKIKLKTSGSSQYNLEFVDGDGNKVDVPIAKTVTASKIKFGDNEKDFINRENETITKDDYFVVTDGARKRGERKTYILQYKGADKVTADNPVLKFKDLGSGKTIEQTYTAGTGEAEQQLATLKVGGADFRVYNVSAIRANDFNIRVDLDASGATNGVNDSFVNITTRYGAEIGLINMSSGAADAEPSAIILTIKTPDSLFDGNAKDSYENIRPIDYGVNITADSSTKVAIAVLTAATSGQQGQRLAERTPDGETNVQYAYTTYGAFIKRESPSSEPGSFEIDYPESQRYALVYIAATGTTFAETGAATTDAVTVQRIQVGAAKLASEVSDVKAQNTILVGGPCANAAAATVMGNPADCTAGFTPGEGMIQLWEHANGNVAMLIAGYGAVDTRNTAAVVSNYKDYKANLKGTKVTVKKVNNQLTVATPVAAATG
ncbi:hypothetical protein HYX00_02080, partial [Candidatus Woesearchaeota archaeon]|nr:hypothetical protein [Candidatus Woesearchaeota archaeon]